MKRSSANYILSLANSYEYQALIDNNPRVWALQSLVSLANDEELLNIFRITLSYFIGLSISKEDFTEWFNKNASIINNQIDLDWETHSDADGSFLSAHLDNLSNNENLHSRIYDKPLSSQSKDFLKIKGEFFLQGSGVIPPLYLYKVIPLNNAPAMRELDQKYAKYYFLAEAFQSIFRPKMDQSFQINFSNFINQNQNKLDKLFGFMSRVPKIIGKGTDGVALDIGPKYILKIFQDKIAFQSALSAMHKLHNNPDLAKTEAMIYDADVLGNFDGFTIYYYIIEKMKTIKSLPPADRSMIANIIQRVVFYINANRQSFKDIKNNIDDLPQSSSLKNKIEKLKKLIVNELLSNVKNEINTLTDNFKLRNDWVDFLVEEIIMKYLTSRTDLHLDNLGLTGYGVFRYFDPSYSSTTSNINYTRFVDQDAKTKERET